jgi:UDP-N-acetylmuramyl pentapeptide phosphotransferase/UDP-N-acetylglucosamine-1-phosphate transferase
MVVGLLDDMWNMSPKLKLALNIAVGVLLLGVGVGQNSFHIFVRASVAAYDQDPSLRLVELVFSIPLTLFIIVGACNATNLIDGMDENVPAACWRSSLGFWVWRSLWLPTARAGAEF